MAGEKKTSFTKSDFLNAEQLAAKLNADVEKVNKTMVLAYKRGISFMYGSSARPMIIKNRACHHSLETNNVLQLHPLGMEKFKELLAKGK